ncbi:hypothetical protein HD554DRAFT_2006247, partial [Boletus coccyginus]
FLCTLPPTCNLPHNEPTPISNFRDLEIHYGKYHAHVCEQRGCGCVFPDERLLELHQTECHDPLAAVRKERGDKIFACHLVSCPRLFSTPKARRLHLIQAHSYPKEYFFAVTNKGVGGLLKRWGDGASMIRRTWRPRDDDKGQETMTKEKETMEIDPDSDGEDDGGEGAEEEDEEEDGDGEDLEEEGGVDDLALSMSSLSLVPPAIQFGRGGKGGGFMHP